MFYQLIYASSLFSLANGDYLLELPRRGSMHYDKAADCVTLTIRPGDRSPYDLAHQRPFERAELINRKAFPFSMPSTISFYQYIAPGSLTNVPTIIGQVHNSAEPDERPLPPIMSMELNKGVQRIVTRSTTERYATATPKPYIRWSGPAKLGTWVHWIWEVTPDPYRGHLRIWRDNIKLVDEDMPLGYNDRRGPYWQFGIYRPLDKTVVRVAYANVIAAPARPASPDGMIPAQPKCSAVAPVSGPQPRF